MHTGIAQGLPRLGAAIIATAFALGAFLGVPAHPASTAGSAHAAAHVVADGQAPGVFYHS
jgi:hypothetical protein